MSNEINSLIPLSKYALSFLWVFTGITSAVISPEFGFNLLKEAGVSKQLAILAVYGGSLVNVFVGVWVIVSIGLRVCCVIQITVILIYTVLLTIIDASFWFHPFGPITKNLPILVLIYIVFKEGKDGLDHVDD